MAYHKHHVELRPDQLYLDAKIRVKGEQACKKFQSKLMRNGITDYRRRISKKGLPYHDYDITLRTRVLYARLMNVVASTEEAESLERM